MPVRDDARSCQLSTWVLAFLDTSSWQQNKQDMFEKHKCTMCKIEKGCIYATYYLLSSGKCSSKLSYYHARVHTLLSGKWWQPGFS